MKNAPTIYKLRQLYEAITKGPQASSDGKNWHPARPLGYYSLKSRLKAAWLVFKGDADAVIWPK